MKLEDLAGDFCAWCDKPFEARSVVHVYCCKRCQYDARNARDKAKYQEKAKALNSGCLCPVCERTFDATTGNQKYCTPACLSASRSLRRRGKPLAEALADLRCEQCNGSMPDATVINTRFCRPCARARYQQQQIEANRIYRERKRAKRARVKPASEMLPRTLPGANKNTSV